MFSRVADERGYSEADYGPKNGARNTRRDALASLGGNHGFRKCVAELLMHRGEERSQEQSDYRQQQ